MGYYLTVAVLFGLALGEAAEARVSGLAWVVGLIGAVGLGLSAAAPAKFIQYSNQQDAAVVLARLARRAAIGSMITAATVLFAWFRIGQWSDAGLLGEMFLFLAIGVFLVHGFGELMTRHVTYLQQTHQYDSNQLLAAIMMITFLLLLIVLYFLAFDLARPPALHPYVRDLVNITLTLVIYSRSVYLMAHH